MDAGEQKALFASLEKTQMRRFEFLESLKQRFEGNREDEVEIQKLCQSVDRTAQTRVDFKTVIEELQQTRGDLEAAADREAELYTPQHYEATFERQLFRRALGLDIRLTEDRLISLVFSQLDQNDPDRQFCVVLDVSENGHWEVVNLEPHVHGVDQLKQQLNSSEGNITQFCKAFREKCKLFIQNVDSPTTTTTTSNTEKSPTI